MARYFFHISLLLIGSPLLNIGCAPMIGDECEAHLDCGTGRICDSTQPNGYCTIANCSPTTCPEFSLCIEFSNGENWCMATCQQESDCRLGYTCVQESGHGAYCGVDTSDNG